MPSSGASHSIVALSVSISASTSPAATLSPFFFFQATSVPSVIVSLSLGIWISGMAGSVNRYIDSRLGIANLPHRRDELVRVRQNRMLESLVIRQRHIFL